MKKTNSKTTGKTQQKNELVCCRDCKFSQLLRYDNDPVIAECYKKPNIIGRHPYERDMAGTMKHCYMFEQAVREKWIEPRTKLRFYERVV